MKNTNFPAKQGLYDPGNEHDSCGVGFVANIDGTKSHQIIERGIEVLQKLLHRGATGGDEQTGDGAGMLVHIPDPFFRRECKSLGVALPAAGQYGVGMVFMPQDKKINTQCQEIFAQVVSDEGLELLGWREVPVDSSSIGKIAREEQPFIIQCFIDGKNLQEAALERRLYVIRKQVEHYVEKVLSLGDSFYIPSLSCRTIVYKGMMMGTQLSSFYKELEDKDFISAVAVIHQRYSTNTFPSWKLAQPFRYLAHNGEINTLRGNLSQMRSREKLLKSDLFGDDMDGTD